MKSSRRNLLRGAALAVPAAALSMAADTASAAPNGVRPTVLSNLSAVSVNSTQMRVTGRLTTLSGTGIPGLKVDIYSVTEYTFVRWSTVYTARDGSFTSQSGKVPSGSRIQIVVDGNGAYSQPFQTLNRP